MINYNGFSESDYKREAPRQLRRDLMARRDAALAAGDHAAFHQLTQQLADLPMSGVKPLTAKDIDRWNRRRR